MRVTLFLPRSIHTVGCRRNPVAIPATQNPCDVPIRATVQNLKRVDTEIFFIGVRTRTYGDFGRSHTPFFRTDSCNTAGNRGRRIDRRSLKYEV
jgi:hypothetical protein